MTFTRRDTKMHVLVSGGSGFLGSAFVALLRKKGIPYRLYDRKHPERTHIDFTHAVHFGGITPHSPGSASFSAVDYLKANVRGTRTFLATIAKNEKLERLVNIGSAAEYGFSQKPFSEIARAKPVNAYGKSKIAQSVLMERFAGKHDVSTVNLRVFNLVALPKRTKYSKRGSVFQMLMRRFSRRTKGPMVVEVSNARSVRDYVDADDVLEAILRALSAQVRKPYELVNICSGRPVSIGTLVNLFSTLTRKPYVLLSASARVDRSVGNPQKAKRLLGWKSRTPLKRSVKKILDL